MEERKDYEGNAPRPGGAAKGIRAFCHRQKDRFSAASWQARLRNLAHYDYRQLYSRAFLRRAVRQALRWGPLALVVFYLLVYFGAFGRMPGYGALKGLRHNTASEVYAADGVLLGRYYLQDRTSVRYADIAPAVIEALVATEDARFYEHRGVDVRSLARVVVKSLLLQRESSGGGSTLSQQLAKNLYPRRRYWLLSTPVNKLQEMIIARKLESVYAKEQILELYLNTVPMGGRLFGIERAAQTYFSTPARSLSVPQAAVLVGMLKANTTYNPRLYPERSLARRNVVLGQMAKYAYLTPARAESLKKQPLGLRYRYRPQHAGMAPYFLAHLRQELEAWCGDNQKEDGTPYNLYTDGLKIYTTLDSKMQLVAEQAVRTRMAGLQRTLEAHYRGNYPWEKDDRSMLPAMKQSRRYQALQAAGASAEEIEAAFRKPVSMPVFTHRGTRRKTLSPFDSLRHYQRFLNAGLLALEPGTGKVRAWVGGIDHQFFKYDHVRSRRQAGSTFKPFVYAAALEQGVEPCRPFPNQRISYPDYEDWSPRNADNRYGGEYRMREALAHSVNTVSAQLIMEAGIDNTIALAERTGIESELPEVPALALGVASVSLLEMVSAYASFSNKGYRVKPVYLTRIADENGRTLRQDEAGEEPETEPALSAENAALVLELLKGVVEEGSAAGLRTRFGLRMDIAGKTGTSQNHSDGWFIGITPDLVTGVWVGAESPLVRFDNLQLGQGAATALPVWGEFMANVARSRGGAFRSGRFPAPPEPVAARLRCDGNDEAGGRKMSAVEAFFDRLFGGSGREAESRPEPAEPAGEGAGPESVGDGGEGEESEEKEGARENERARRREEKARERENKAAERRREDARKDAERAREDARKAEERSREDAKKREEKRREREKKERERDNE
ncbi:MAG: Multimodular transpeptidase-transglycosylase [uncultured Cytophagales bacterium]|uniref:Multimodular transpeptidase-transglycosylase n=1 Tax=uncultured Cytophagales bacterium TaxID=158755 RepID=A0A6J4HBH1_9SPHI|nr:MAG: Multimodular transpeptidase-transglycosylase [uncultured Cytophagales bacterium]